MPTPRRGSPRSASRPAARRDPPAADGPMDAHGDDEAITSEPSEERARGLGPVPTRTERVRPVSAGASEWRRRVAGKQGGTAARCTGSGVVPADRDRHRRSTEPDTDGRTPPSTRSPTSPRSRSAILDRWARDRTFLESIAQREDRGRRRVRLLRRPAVRQRPAALRPPADRLRQGRRAPLPDDARPASSHRRFGWDCHGLPAEVEAEKELGIAGHPEITALRHRQVQRRLPHQRAALHRRVGALRHPPGPLGRLRERLQDARPRLHGERHVGVQDAVGQGPRLRGLPGAGVLLAVRDAAQQHRDAHGRRVPRPPGPGAHRRASSSSTTPARRPARCWLAWTTTPWTLPANLALAVGPDVDYAVVEPRRVARRDPRRGAARATTPPSWATARRRRAGCTGRELVGRRYRPLFDFFADVDRYGTEQAFQVLAADFVATEDGTGVVHIAPGFGEDDQLVANAAGIPTVVPMDEHGRYTRRGHRLGRRARVRRQPRT